MTKAVWGSRIRLVTAVVLTIASASCGDVVRQGTASSYLVISTLEGASGADPTKFGTNVFSDVITINKDDGTATIFEDPGRVTFKLGMKDPGSAGTAVTPTQNNWITLSQYHVQYVRSDGHNVEGVDVPYAFDGGMTGTVGTADLTGGFMVVRSQAKQEAPLAALQTNPIAISTIAKVTFYGRDQTGREVSVTGSIDVTFANYGDPK
jgi:hypothetical protein